MFILQVEHCHSAILEELKSGEVHRVDNLFSEGFRLLQWLQLKEGSLHDPAMDEKGNQDNSTTSIPSAAYLASAPVSVYVSS